MATSLVSNKAARDAVLGRVKNALGVTGDRATARREADSYMAAHGQGPRPAMPADLLAKFMVRAADMESTIERVADRMAIPAAVAHYIDSLELPAPLASQKSRKGVCWPEFANLDWKGAGLVIEARPTKGDDRLGITGTFCAIAETGTLETGKSADLAIWEIERPAELVYRMGFNPLNQRIWRGR